VVAGTQCLSFTFSDLVFVALMATNFFALRTTVSKNVDLIVLTPDEAYEKLRQMPERRPVT
jgi:hypothetical protein